VIRLSGVFASGLLAAGRFDVPALQRYYQSRIESIDRAGPQLNSTRKNQPQ
jgi:hypothetical protein